jgi:hypothetical protein
MSATHTGEGDIFSNTGFQNIHTGGGNQIIQIGELMQGLISR